MGEWDDDVWLMQAGRWADAVLDPRPRGRVGTRDALLLAGRFSGLCVTATSLDQVRTSHLYAGHAHGVVEGLVAVGLLDGDEAYRARLWAHELHRALWSRFG